MIVVDSSAVIAIMTGEADAWALSERLKRDPVRVMSAISYVETGAVLACRHRSQPERAVVHLDRFLEESAITIAPVDAPQARLAMAARVRYGRGMGHGGLLNLGDVFSYALARINRAPLLFIGNDFGTTDVEVALPPGGAR